MAWIVVLIILMIALIGVLPFWPYSRSWGTLPTAVVLGILIVFALLVWFGVAAVWWPEAA